MELVAHGSMVTIRLESPYRSAYRQVVVLGGGRLSRGDGRFG